MINGFVLNGDRLNGSDVPMIASGRILAFEQIIGKIYSTRIARFSQRIIFRETASGSLIDFEQSIKNAGIGQIFYFEQLIL